MIKGSYCMIVHWLILPGIAGIVSCLALPVGKYTLEKTEGAIKNGQSRATVNIRYTQDTARRKNTGKKIEKMNNATSSNKTGGFAFYVYHYAANMIYCTMLSIINLIIQRNACVIVNVIASGAVDRWFEP